MHKNKGIEIPKEMQHKREEKKKIVNNIAHI